MGTETFLFSALLAANCILEWKLLSLSRSIRRFVIKHRGIGLFLSIFMSLTIGNLFGASGILCLASGLLSTFVMAVLYRCMTAYDGVLVSIAVRREEWRRTHPDQPDPKLGWVTYRAHAFYDHAYVALAVRREEWRQRRGAVPAFS